MYEMLTGQVPFDADTAVSVALKHMQEEPIEPMELNPDIPKAVNDIIMKAMQKDTGLRYQSATEMLKDINMALKRPDGDFVNLRTAGGNFETQRFEPLEDEEIRTKRNNKKDENKFKKFISNHKVLSFFIGAILLFAIAFGGTALVSKLVFNQDVNLPNFVGMTKEEAQKEADKIKVKLEFEEEFSADVEEGKVISQDPEFKENSKIKEKSTVKLKISKGTELVKVPKVTGMEKEEAIKTLEDLGLKVEIKEETSKKVEEGYVINQDIAENKEINAGDTVTITVSTGTGITQVSVPSVTGKTENEARTTLESAKLKVTVNYEEDSSKTEGIVLKQNVESGKKVDEGTTVTITVNKAESKSGTVTVNVKSITGGYDSSDTDLTDTDKKAKIDIKVDGTSVYTQSNVDKNSTAISTSFSGKGKVQIVVNIQDGNGASYTRTTELDLSKQTTYTAQ